ncbi:uncharacterized protein HGUI_01179 [Hanseniaspora guilliermondii]|uniref:Uncharacterized protein n=1 Tax=Hanseniaspora guilliermondii TaxID=56406 RepID=A0A1L0B244_9ASCO|nr:uncharacterized protein HGUI_01179 [Hanseniaspora guilliermondii]
MSDNEEQVNSVNFELLNSLYTIDVKMLPCKTSSLSEDQVYKTTELDQLYPDPKEFIDNKEILYLRGRKLIGEEISLDKQECYLFNTSSLDQTINLELKAQSVMNFEREGNTDRLTNEKENLLEYIDVLNAIMS